MPLGSGWSAARSAWPAAVNASRSGTGAAKLFERVMMREIAEFDLQRHGPAGDFGALDAIPGIAGDALELGREPLGIAQILVEGPLGADRLVRPVGLHLALVDPAANPPIPFGRASEMRLQRRQGSIREGRRR